MYMYVEQSYEDPRALVLRRVTVKAMRTFGAYRGGKMAEIILGVLDDIVTHLTAVSGQAVDIQELSNGFVVNVLLTLVCAKIFYQDSSQSEKRFSLMLMLPLGRNALYYQYMYFTFLCINIHAQKIHM